MHSQNTIYKLKLLVRKTYWALRQQFLWKAITSCYAKVKFPSENVINNNKVHLLTWAIYWQRVSWVNLLLGIWTVLVQLEKIDLT